MVILGVGYSIVAAALWPSIALVVPGSVVGTANGIATSVQMLGVGLCNLATGAIVDVAGYPALMKMFLGFACAATLGGALQLFVAFEPCVMSNNSFSCCSNCCNSNGQRRQV
jgi:hypothetical protein